MSVALNIPSLRHNVSQVTMDYFIKIRPWPRALAGEYLKKIGLLVVFQTKV